MAAAPRLPKPFKLERFFAQHEFNAPHLLCCSDCEPLHLKELLALADDDSLRRFDTLRLSYTESQGLPALRDEVSKLFKSVAAEQVVVCVPEEGIYLTMRALLQPGDTVVTAFPAYQSLYELANSIGCTVRHWEPRPSESGRLQFDIQQALALIRPGVKAVVVNFPHNPTGAMLGAAEWGQLVDACRAAGAWLFSDEMYRFTERDPADRLPSAVDVYERGISLCGLSKSWALPGLRMGWVACKDRELLEQVLALKDYTTITSAAPSEVLALAAVRATDRLTQRSRDIIAANTAVADGFFARWSRVFEWHAPQAGPVAFPRLLTGEPVGAWCARLVGGCGVLLLPADVYEHQASAERGHFRLSLGRTDMPACLRVLDEWLVKEHGEPDA